MILVALRHGNSWIKLGAQEVVNVRVEPSELEGYPASHVVSILSCSTTRNKNQNKRQRTTVIMVLSRTIPSMLDPQIAFD